jgi:hypothetical protein
VSCLDLNEKDYFYKSGVPSPDLKCYSIFRFESQSDVFFFSRWICALVLKPSSLVDAAVFLALARSPVSSLRGAFLGLVPSLAKGLVFFLLAVDLALSSCLALRLRFIFSPIFPRLGLWSIL